MSQPQSASSVLPNCVLCKDAIMDSGSMYIPPYGHPLHSYCLGKIPKNSLVCPVFEGKLKATQPQRPSTTGNVNTQLPPTFVTRVRAQSQRALEYDNNRSNNVPHTYPNISFMSSSSPQCQRNQLQSMVSAAVSAQQAVMLSTLSQHLTKLIESNFEAGFQRLNLSVQSPSATPKQYSALNQNQQILTLPAVELGLPSNRNPSAQNSSVTRASTGGSKGIPVFKASDGFWRYHKASRRIVLPELCSALRAQYKNSLEAFDLFCEAIIDISQDKSGHRFQDCLDEKRVFCYVHRKVRSSCELKLQQIFLILTRDHIAIGSATPIKQRHFPLSPAMKKHICAELDRMLENDVIEESDNAWSFPNVLVRKPGKVMLCLDSRKVNSPLPNIDGILSRLPKTEFITSLDIKDAFWQNRHAFWAMKCDSDDDEANGQSDTVEFENRNTFAGHLEVLREISKQIRFAGLTISEVRYLRHLVGNEVIQIDSGKISAIIEFPTPRSNYAAVTSPLTDLLKTSRKFIWSEEVQNPDFSQHEISHCDATFMSKKLNQSQRNYSVTEQECLAAMLIIKKFQISRLARWALKLQGFTFKIEHRKGSQNVVPDALSHTNTEDLSKINCLSLSVLDDSGVFVDLPSVNSRTELGKTSKPKTFKLFMNTCTDDDLAWKLWIPKEAHDSHLSSHGGINKTLERIRRFYFWPNLVNDVRCYINSCDVCKGTKYPNFVMRQPIDSFRNFTLTFLVPIHVPRQVTGEKVYSGHCGQIYGRETIPYIRTPEVIVSDNGSHTFVQRYTRPKQMPQNGSIVQCYQQSGHILNTIKVIGMNTSAYMITNGNTYALLRKLEMLDDREVKLNREDSFNIIRNRAAIANFSQYQNGRSLGVYHAKDIPVSALCCLLTPKSVFGWGVMHFGKQHFYCEEFHLNLTVFGDLVSNDVSICCQLVLKDNAVLLSKDKRKTFSTPRQKHFWTIKYTFMLLPGDKSCSHTIFSLNCPAHEWTTLTENVLGNIILHNSEYYGGIQIEEEKTHLLEDENTHLQEEEKTHLLEDKTLLEDTSHLKVSTAGLPEVSSKLLLDVPQLGISSSRLVTRIVILPQHRWRAFSTFGSFTRVTSAIENRRKLQTQNLRLRRFRPHSCFLQSKPRPEIFPDKCLREEDSSMGQSRTDHLTYHLCQSSLYTLQRDSKETIASALAYKGDTKVTTVFILDYKEFICDEVPKTYELESASQPDGGILVENNNNFSKRWCIISRLLEDSKETTVPAPAYKGDTKVTTVFILDYKGYIREE
ncbi:Retrovirus-related Pol polyprotein from transposon 297 [Lucilia cuprina]|nr:Retrovirus-related Pol polyprotein from transposon 297 [Lucilia cuprina]